MVVMMAWMLSGAGVTKPNGEAISPDFGIFYVAGGVAAGGQAALAYDWQDLTHRYGLLLVAPKGNILWNYPPTFLVVAMVLAGLPYLVAAGIWTAGGLAALLMVVRPFVAQEPAALMAVLVFPGLGLNLVAGQTGLWATAFLGGGLLTMTRHPLLAGVFFGLLTMKPQLAFLVPIALVAGGCRRVLAASAVTAIAMAVASFFIFGLEPWQAFFQNLTVLQGFADRHALPYFRMPTVFMALEGLGCGPTLARTAQAVATLTAVAMVVWSWRRWPSHGLRCAALVSAMPFASPYLFDYDLNIMILPILWLWREAATNGWRRGEAGWLLVVGVLVVFPSDLTERLGFQTGLLFAAILLSLIWARGQADANKELRVFFDHV
jgi:hypothetical protein